MVAVGWGSGSIMGHGGISFNESITLYDVDGTVTVRHMNPDGGFYDAAEELYEEDVSLHLSESDDVGLDDDDDGDDGGFMDALQEQLKQDDSSLLDEDAFSDGGGSEGYFQGSG